MRDKQVIHVPFPLKGLDINWGRMSQPEGSTFESLNMRPYDTIGNRARGGSRPGLSKYSTVQDQNARIQCIVQSIAPASSAMTQANASSLTIVNLCVVNGDVNSFTATTQTAVSGGANLLSATAPVIFAAQIFGDVYFASDSALAKYNQGSGATAWTASAGSIPSAGGSTIFPRLICEWNERIVLAGLRGDETNWFMSRRGDPTDWDYSPTAGVDEEQAVAGSSGEAGEIGQPIMTLIPYTDDTLLFGCSQSIWQLSGDPMAGGRFDLITNAVGTAWGKPWCKSPGGVVYFMGQNGGFYTMTPGSKPDRMSASRIEKALSTVDLNTTIVTMEWNDETPGVHLFLTPTTQGASDHWFWDARHNAFFKDRFGHSRFNPVATCNLHSESSASRALVIGSEDGYIRKFSDSAYTDDGVGFDSHVFLGPWFFEQGDLQFLVNKIEAVIAKSGSNIQWRLYCSECIESMLPPAECVALIGSRGRLLLNGSNRGLILNSSSGREDEQTHGTFAAPFAYSANPKRRGYVACLCLQNVTASTAAWAMENVTLELGIIKNSKDRQL